MDRRAFLALIATAPIAALAPWPKFLPTPQLAFHPKAFAIAMEPLVATHTISSTSLDRSLRAHREPGRATDHPA